MFMHFNIKAWTPLINPNTYDAFYYKLDNLTPIPEWLSALGKLMDVGDNFFTFYFLLFIFMFSVSFVLHSAFDNFKNFRKVVVGTCLVLLLGGISYWIAPAVGPFIYESSKLAGFPETQKEMYAVYLNIVSTGKIPNGFFSGSLAAMPSLHVANSLFFLLCARRSLKWLQIFYVPIFIFIIIVAVASKYHYVIDLFFGVLLSVFVYWLVNKIYD
jgi:membrane-associated phospholipid phosphatase